MNLVSAGMVGNIHVVACHVKAANDGESPLAAPVEVYAVLATLYGFGRLVWDLHPGEGAKFGCC